MRKDLTGFGKLLRDLIYSRRIDETELSERLSVNKSYISNMVSNKVIPSFHILSRINEILHLTPNEANSFYYASLENKKEIILKTSDYSELPEYNNFLESLKNLIFPYSTLAIESSCDQKSLPSLVKEIEKVNCHKMDLLDIINNQGQNILKITYYVKNKENEEMEINNVRGLVLFVDDYNNIVIFLDEFLDSEQKCSITSNSFYWISLDFVISIENCDKQNSCISLAKYKSPHWQKSKTNDKFEYCFSILENNSKNRDIKLTCNKNSKQKSSVENCQIT